MKSEKKGFVFYHSWIEAMAYLTNEQKGELIQAIADRDRYGADYAGTDAAIRKCCASIFPALDDNKQKYIERCAKKCRGRT